MENIFITAAKKRRTQYAISNNVTLTQAQITELIQSAVRLAPSAFNSQSARIVILFNEQNNKFWDIVGNTLKPLVSADAFQNTRLKLKGFSSGIGTILFYEDLDVIDSLQKQIPLYADNFPVWSEHGSAIAQYSVWTALANADIGASLQHYNPVIDNSVADAFGISKSWRLRAQMPFGSNEAGFKEKEFIDNAIRFRVID